MILTEKNIAAMIDLSCVRTNNTKADIEELVNCAKRYEIGQVTVLQSFIPYVKELLEDTSKIRLSGNVSFPAGSDSTTLKVIQTRQLVGAGCDEIDLVMNVGKFLSGEYSEVEADVKAVVEAAHPLPVKVIIEMVYLNPKEVEKACEISIDAGAAFIKTGTGWIGNGTTVDDIKLIKSIVGDRIQIKAAGGIRKLETLVEMYKEGARRFGVNLRSGINIIEEYAANAEKIES